MIIILFQEEEGFNRGLIFLRIRPAMNNVYMSVIENNITNKLLSGSHVDCIHLYFFWRIDFVQQF